MVIFKITLQASTKGRELLTLEQFPYKPLRSALASCCVLSYCPDVLKDPDNCP